MRYAQPKYSQGPKVKYGIDVPLLFEKSTCNLS